MALKFGKKKDEMPIPRRKPEEKKHLPEPEEGWLVSYADMMTLLCGFFIMMFSMAKLDEPKYEKVKEAIAKQFGGDYKSPNKETAKYMTQIIQELGVPKDTLVRVDPSGIAIAFTSTIFFDTMGAEISEQGKAVVSKLIEAIASRQDKEMKKYKIVVEGHTDSRPLVAGLYPSNWELSAARATRVVRMFLDKGFEPDHLTAIGYGDTRPQYPERSPSGEFNLENQAKNRRVVLRILEPKVDSIPYPETDKNLTPAEDGAKPANPAH